MNQPSPTCLYFFHLYTPFIDIDDTIMQKEYRVKHCSFTISSPLSIPWLMLKQTLFVMRNTNAAVMVCMFAGYHTLIPVLLAKLLNKPILIIVGGIDGVALPEIRYGNFQKKWLSKITAWSLKNCTHIAPISEYLVQSEYSYCDLAVKKQGIKHLVKDLRTPVTVIYNGFKTERWPLTEPARQDLSFLTVAANLDDRVRLMVKGVDLVLELAALMPEATFTIIGKNNPAQAALPANVTILPFQTQEKLKELYASHRFYLQLSMSEGFGNTLAEAMLCGCIPIGSNAGAIPMVIGDEAFVLKNKEVHQLLQLIHCVLQRTDLQEVRTQMRNRILEKFSIANREKKLLSLLKEIRR